MMGKICDVIDIDEIINIFNNSILTYRRGEQNPSNSEKSLKFKIAQ